MALSPATASALGALRRVVPEVPGPASTGPAAPSSPPVPLPVAPTPGALGRAIAGAAATSTIPATHAPRRALDGAAIVAAYMEQDARLAARGWYATPAPWVQALRVAVSGRVHVARGGRRAGKSSWGSRLAVCVAAGSPAPGNGDEGVFAVLSATRGQGDAPPRRTRKRPAPDGFGSGAGALGEGRWRCYAIASGASMRLRASAALRSLARSLASTFARSRCIASRSVAPVA